MSYLSGSSLHVFVDEGLSDSLHFPLGIPQASCLRRYCSPCTLVSYLKCSKVICRQYMHMLYLSFKPDNSLMEQDAMEIMEKCIHDIRIWMLTDQLKLNDNKTEFMVIGTRLQLGKVSTGELSIGYSKVVPVSTAKNLGVWLDTHLKLDTRLTKMSNAAYYHLHNI